MVKPVKKHGGLPPNVEENILSRLPVKTLLKFMSVCKLWESLIKSTYFSNHHIQNYSNNLLVMSQSKSKRIEVINPSSSVVHSRVGPKKTNKFQYKRTIVGSCNGIVCLFFSSHYPDNNQYIVLWNPALKIIKKIFECIGCAKVKRKRYFVGFGFHSQSLDYKVVRFEIPYHENQELRVDIYSLSSDSWKFVAVPTPRHINRPMRSFADAAVGVYVNGAYHWAIRYTINYKKRFSTIFSFDMRDEVFKEISVPSGCERSQMILFNNNENLSLLTFENMGLSAFFWVMKDYGLPETWTNLCEIDMPPQLGMGDFWRVIHIKNEVILSRNIGGAKEVTIVLDIDKSKVEVKDHISSIANTELLKDAIEVEPYKPSLLLLLAGGTTEPDPVCVPFLMDSYGSGEGYMSWLEHAKPQPKEFPLSISY